MRIEVEQGAACLEWKTDETNENKLEKSKTFKMLWKSTVKSIV